MTGLELTLAGGLVSILVGVVTHSLTKSSMQKRIDSSLEKHEEDEDQFEDRITTVLEKLADKVTETSNSVIRIETRLHSYDEIWKKIDGLHKQGQEHAKSIASLETHVQNCPAKYIKD